MIAEQTNIKSGYKKTIVGFIPNDWNVSKIIDVANYVDFRGKTPSKTEQGIFLVTAKNIKNGYIDYESSKEYIAFDDYKNVMSRGLPVKGDVLITTEAPLGSVAQIDNENIALAQRIIKYRAKKDLLVNDFLKYYFLSPYFQRLLEEKSTGSTAKGIKGSTLHKLSIILPPLPEQQKIAYILSTWDEAIAATKTLIVQTKKRNQGLAQQLLTGKKRLKGFEGKWEKLKFKEVITRITRKNAIENTNVVTISAQRGFVRQDDFFKKQIASETLTNYYLIEKGEFAYNKSYSNGYPMGAFKRLDNFDYGVVTTLYICFKINKGFNSDFFIHFFESGLMNKEITKIAQEGGRAHGLLNIGLEDFLNLNLTIPAENEQKAIAEVLETANQELKTLEQKLKNLQEQKKGLMQKLLTGEIRVKIN